MKWVPHGYQIEALSFLLVNPKSGLFLDPGLGKTPISLSAIRILKMTDDIKAVLIVAPLRVIYDVWPNEIKKWSNFRSLTHTILHGKGKKTLFGPKKDIYLINPEGLPWLLDQLYKAVTKEKPIPFDTLWIDESTKFKSPKAKTRFKTIETMLSLFKRVHIMTGTPAARSYLDLWSQIFILDQGKALTPSFYRFRNKYFMTAEYNKFNWLPKKGTLNYIKDLIAPLVLDMSEKDHLKMPPVTYNYINVTIPEKGMKTYKEMEQDLFSVLDFGEVSAKAAAQCTMKCHQISNGMIYEDIPFDLSKDELREFMKTRKVHPIHRAKIDALKDLIEELNGKPILIAYHYKHDLSSIRNAIGKDTPYIGSGVSSKESTRITKDWNAGKIPVLLGQPQSMAHGLNLQGGGNDICWYSLTWNLEDYIQFNKRIDRQGVNGAVRIHHLVSSGTIDNAMVSRLGERSKNQQDLRDAIKQYRRNL
jgi:SNF2 family DNA or RNA helicase